MKSSWLWNAKERERYEVLTYLTLRLLRIVDVVLMDRRNDAIRKRFRGHHPSWHKLVDLLLQSIMCTWGDRSSIHSGLACFFLSHLSSLGCRQSNHIRGGQSNFNVTPTHPCQPVTLQTFKFKILNIFKKCPLSTISHKHMIYTYLIPGMLYS